MLRASCLSSECRSCFPEIGFLLFSFGSLEFVGANKIGYFGNSLGSAASSESALGCGVGSRALAVRARLVLVDGSVHFLDLLEIRDDILTIIVSSTYHP